MEVKKFFKPLKYSNSKMFI